MAAGARFGAFVIAVSLLTTTPLLVPSPVASAASRPEVPTAATGPLVEAGGFYFVAIPLGGGGVFPPGKQLDLVLGPWESPKVVHFREVIGGEETDLGSPVCGADTCQLPISPATEGDHVYRAVVESPVGDPVVLELTVSVARVAMTFSIWTYIPPDPEPVQANHEIWLTADFHYTTSWSYAAPVVWRDADTDEVLGESPAENPYLFIPGEEAKVGVRHVVAEYAGNEVYLPATSPVLELVIGPDLLDATGVGVSRKTFYPARDGYRDKLIVSGYRLEPASVGIRIYAPNGKVVRKATIGRGEWGYKYTWNGRTDAGKILAAGTYRIAQKLTDANGNSRTWTSYVKLSTKRLVTHTTYVSKPGSSVGAKSAYGTGSVRISTSAGTVRLNAGSGGAAAGWELRVPAATVYLSVAFQVRSTAVLSAPPNEIAVQNFRQCARTSGDWNASCFDHWNSIGDSSPAYSWSSTISKSSASRSSRYVRGLVIVRTGTVTVSGVRLKVKYQVLQ